MTHFIVFLRIPALILGGVPIDEIPNNTDLNTVKGVGNGIKFYRVVCNTLINGYPTTDDNYRGFLLVLNIANSYIFQVAFDSNGSANKIYHRCTQAGVTWSTWSE